MLLLPFAACAPPIVVQSPSDGATVHAPWIPLSVGLPAEESTVRTWIDGVEATDPLGVVRARTGRLGGGVDYLATLDLLELEPGTHTLTVRAVTPGSTDSEATVTFEYDRPSCRLDLTFVDDDGEPVAARVKLRDEDGPVDLAAPDGATADPSERDIHLSTVFAPRGEASVWVDPGYYTVVAGRGPRDALVVEEIEVTGDTARTFVLPPVIDTPGVLGADLHVHTARSADAFVPDRMRYESLLTAGLDAFVITDHKVTVDPRTRLEAVQGEEGAVHGLVGVEARFERRNEDGTVDSLGHMNAFPVATEAEAPLPDQGVEDALDVARILDAWRVRQRAHPYRGDTEGVLVQLNHPSGIQFFPEEEPELGAHAFFSHFRVDHGTPAGEGTNAWTTTTPDGSSTTPLAFDAIEILNRFSWAIYLQMRYDWFWMLDQGFRVTGTGNSDSHALEVELAGLPTNLVAVEPPGVGEELDAAAMVEAVQAGRVAVTTGPVVTVEVHAGDRTGEPGELVAGEAGEWEVLVRVRAAEWVPVDQLRVVAGGRLVYGEVVSDAPRAADGTLDLTRTVPLRASADTWVLVEAGWPLGEDPPEDDGYERLGPYAWFAPGYVPIGFTNPVWLDADGDGAWSASAR